MVKNLFLILLFVFPIEAFSQNDQYGTIACRICELNIRHTESDSILSILNRLSDDGKFSDIDYNVRSGDVWPSREHYYRLLDLANAFKYSDSVFRNDTLLLNKLVAGLDFWCTKKPIHNNWWFRTIEEPQMLGLITINLKYGNNQNCLPLDIETKLINHCNEIRTSLSDHGANESQIAMHYVYWGVIQEDADLLSSGITTLFNIACYSPTVDGLKIDNSFVSTGCFYIGAYGEQFLNNIMNIMYYTHGTQFALPESQLTNIRDYFLQTYSNVIRGRVMAYNAMGRSVTYKDFLCNVPKRSSFAELMKTLDPKYEELYGDICKRFTGEEDPSYKMKSHHHHYWIGDYSLHNRSAFSFGCRVTSSRSMRTENGNGEGECTYYISDGSTWLARTGEEYNNIMPLWDWSKIPGTTTPKLSEQPISKAWTVYGTTEFSGGVSDSIYGCTAYKYYDEYSNINTGGNKGYFFFDDEVVCLGSNLSSSHDFCTTVEQNWGKDEVVVARKDFSRTTYSGTFEEKNIDNVSWVLHDSIGYYFPKDCQITLRNASVSGNWHDIAKTQENREITGQVFLLTMPHQNQDGLKKDYEYVLLPGKDEVDMEVYKSNCPLQILNTDSVQIVSHSALKITECVYYSACQVSFNNYYIKVDKPCLLLIKEVNDSLIIHVADPRQKKEPILVSISNGDRGISDILEVPFDSVEKDTEGAAKKFVLTGTSESINDNIYTLSDTLVKIYSTSGKLLYNGKKINVADAMAKLRSGVYIFEFKNKNATNRRKVMIP